MLCSESACWSPVVWALGCLLLSVGAEDNQTSRSETTEGGTGTLTAPLDTLTDSGNTTDFFAEMGIENSTQTPKPWTEDEISQLNGTSSIPAWDISNGTVFPGNASSTTTAVRHTAESTTQKVSTGINYPGPENAARFEYDEKSLRTGGLVFACVCFVLGIGILFLGRVRIPRCSGLSTGRKQGKYTISSQT